ncbi:ATP-binding cassette domain-containing protein [Schumannella sp. 10F1B-5-1]|uniref:ATP-binding cassette domain-containing protein n=1 Tax=Schumannella sp. 10F1B-5-1 TaxID=2590780 RepID=UPI001C6408D6|nr:ATP-binding cassette domain-containing protein [Schumannella sp. 10F1B-5-1]
MSGLEAQVVASRGAFTVDARLTAPGGTTLALLGANGVGKSTLLQAIAGILPLDAGRVAVGDRTLADAATGRETPIAERRVGVVFQDYLLFPHLTVLDNVAFGPRSRGLGRREARARARDWLDRVGLAEAADRHPDQVSGGQAQRVAVARALASEPDLLLLDEPLAALDAETRVDMRDELAGHLARFAGPAIVITHSRADAVALAADAVVLDGGRVSQAGSLAEVLDAPMSGFARRFADGDFG